jgi:hypothetical protein
VGYLTTQVPLIRWDREIRHTLSNRKSQDFGPVKSMLKKVMVDLYWRRVHLHPVVPPSPISIL